MGWEWGSLILTSPLAPVPRQSSQSNDSTRVTGFWEDSIRLCVSSACSGAVTQEVSHIALFLLFLKLT